MSRESIAGKTTWTAVISCAVLGLVSLALGLGVYSNQMIRMFIHHAYNTALHASMSVENGTGAEPYAKKIMEIYRSMTPEERAMTGTQEYRDRFLKERGTILCPELHKQVFGRSYVFTDPVQHEEFMYLEGHAEKCAEVVASAVKVACEMLLEDEE